MEKDKPNQDQSAIMIVYNRNDDSIKINATPDLKLSHMLGILDMAQKYVLDQAKPKP